MFLPSVMSLGKVKMKPFICIWLNPAIILIYHLNQVNWPKWWTMTIHPSALWLLCWNARRNSSQPKTNVTITLLLLPPQEIAALSCWCSCTQAALSNTRFSAQRLFFAFSPPFFLQSQSPFSISIRRHSSAKCISAFSGYPSITVSALNTDLTAAAAAWRWKALDTTLPSTWHFYMTTPLNVELTKKC